MAILLRQQRVVAQHATSHDTLANNTCHSLKYGNWWKGISKTNFHQAPFASFIEAGHFGCFNASVIMRDRAREHGLEVSHNPT